MKKFVKIIVLAMAAIMTVSSTACTKKGGGGGGDNELRFYLWSDDGGMPLGFQSVLDEFNNGAGQELGIKLNFSFDTQGDYRQNLNLLIASGQANYDVVFDAQWIYLSEFAKRDYYYNLQSFFHNDSYPGLKAAFNTEYVNNNKFNNGVYGIPLTQTFGEISVAYIRKDWREECAADTGFTKPAGISSIQVTNTDLEDGIDSFDELQYYLYWVKANKPGVVPALSNNDATWGAWDLINTHALPPRSAQDKVNAGIKEGINIMQQFDAQAFIRNGEVMAVEIPDSNPEVEGGIKDFPQGFTTPSNNDAKQQADFQIARRWRDDGIIGADVMSTTDADAQFKAGMGGAVVQTINNFGSVESLLKQNNPGAELEIYVNDPAIREKREGYARTDFKAWNFLCIPKTTTTQKRDLTMKFFDWLFSSEENHDLFQYGIRGTHWDVATDENGDEIEGTVKTLSTPYTFPAYQLTWNPTFIRVQTASDPKVLEYMQYMFDINRYVAIPYAEFQFDQHRTTELSTAISNTTIASNITQIRTYYLGQVADPVASWNSVLTNRYNNTQLQSALTVIRNEVRYQLQAYLDSIE